MGDNLDLKLISGEFLNEQIPQNKEYLQKYFSGDIPLRFLSYYLAFKSLIPYKGRKYFCQSFIDHTGLYCCGKQLYKLLQKITKLENAIEFAHRESDLETLAKIKSGNYR